MTERKHPLASTRTTGRTELDAGDFEVEDDMPTTKLPLPRNPSGELALETEPLDEPSLPK